jgi:hypothetical protein
MTTGMEEFVTCFKSDRVPSLWRLHAYPSKKQLSAWLASLSARIAFIREVSLIFIFVVVMVPACNGTLATGVLAWRIFLPKSLFNSSHSGPRPRERRGH